MTELMNYETVGDPNQPSILMVHGMLSSNVQWSDNKAALSKYFHLVMVELWGHGDSPEPKSDAACDAESYCLQLETIRKKLNIKKWHVIGQSYGAAVAIKYCLRFPEHAIRLVISNSKLALASKNTKSFVFDKDFNIKDIRELPIHPIHSKRIPEPMKSKLIKVADRLKISSLEKLIRRRSTLNCRDNLHELQLPVLLCQGIYETKFKEPAAFAGVTIPDIKIVEINAGHNPNRDQPKEFNMAVLEFLMTAK